MMRFDLLEPASIEEALELLAREDARVIGGGTALVVLMKNRLLSPKYLVSLRKVPGQAFVGTSGTGVRLGAYTRLWEIESSPLVAEQVPLLGTIVRQIGNVRVRATATVGGTLCEADYQSDFSAGLVALGARVRARSLRQERVIPIEEFFVGSYTTALEPHELVIGVEVDAPPAGAGTAYLKHVTGPATDRPCVAVAAVLGVDATGRCTHCRLVVGAVNGVSSLPLRIRPAEELIVGRELTAEAIEAMSAIAHEEADPVSDLKAPDWYKKRMVRVFCRRALEEAWRSGLRPAARGGSEGGVR